MAYNIFVFGLHSALADVSLRLAWTVAWLRAAMLLVLMEVGVQCGGKECWSSTEEEGWAQGWMESGGLGDVSWFDDKVRTGR